MSNEFKFNCAGKILDLNKPGVMGILNVTPDSFYQGSRCSDNWLNVAEQMIRDGQKFSILVVSRHAPVPQARQPRSRSWNGFCR